MLYFDLDPGYCQGHSFNHATPLPESWAKFNLSISASDVKRRKWFLLKGFNSYTITITRLEQATA